MGERQRYQRLGDEETGRCGCGRRGTDGRGECTYCAEDMSMSQTNLDRLSGPVKDVTELYKQKAK